LTQTLLSYWLLLALVLYAGSHLAILVGLFRVPPKYMGFVALVLPPLAPYYAWRRGLRRRTLVWLGALLAYAAAVIVANL
jgi:hypothetical protein